MTRFMFALGALLVSAQAALAGGIVAPPTTVPEPISLSLLAMGVGGVVVHRYLRKR